MYTYYIYIYIYVYIIHIYKYTQTRTHTQTHTHSLTHTRTHARTHTYKHTHAHTYTHTYTHTHARNRGIRRANNAAHTQNWPAPLLTPHGFLLQCVAGSRRVLQCVVECCSVLQCVSQCYMRAHSLPHTCTHAHKSHKHMHTQIHTHQYTHTHTRTHALVRTHEGQLLRMSKYWQAKFTYKRDILHVTLSLYKESRSYVYFCQTYRVRTHTKQIYMRTHIIHASLQTCKHTFTHLPTQRHIVHTPECMQTYVSKYTFLHHVHLSTLWAFGHSAGIVSPHRATRYVSPSSRSDAPSHRNRNTFKKKLLVNLRTNRMCPLLFIQFSKIRLWQRFVHQVRQQTMLTSTFDGVCFPCTQCTRINEVSNSFSFFLCLTYWVRSCVFRYIGCCLWVICAVLSRCMNSIRVKFKQYGVCVHCLNVSILCVFTCQESGLRCSFECDPSVQRYACIQTVYMLYAVRFK